MTGAVVPFGFEVYVRNHDLPGQLAFPLDLRPYPCSQCIWANQCNGISTHHQCGPRWPSPGAGEHELWAGHIEATARFKAEKGFSFLPVAPRCPVVPTPPSGILPVCYRGRPGLQANGWTAVKVSEVLNATRVRTKQDVITTLGLPKSTRVLVEWFEEDDTLERLDVYFDDILPHLAGAGFDLHTAPSFPNYRNRTYFHARYGMKRSLNRYIRLLEASVPAIPHLSPLTIGDVRDYADWITRSQVIQTVSLDITCSMKAGNHYALTLVELLDRLTDHRLHFYLHGPSSDKNIDAALQAISDDRLTVANGHSVHSVFRASPDRLAARRTLKGQERAWNASATERTEGRDDNAA